MRLSALMGAFATLKVIEGFPDAVCSSRCCWLYQFIQLSAFNGERESVRRSHLHEGSVLRLTDHSSGAEGERFILGVGSGALGSQT